MSDTVKPKTTLMGAYGRHKGLENRVTQVPAAVADGVPEFAQALAGAAGFTTTTPVAIATQVRFGRRYSVDLELRGQDASGPWVAWFEHEVGDRLSRDQLERELKGLAQEHPAARTQLVATTLHPVPAQVFDGLAVRHLR